MIKIKNGLIRDLRELRGLSWEELAVKVGVTEKQIAAWENGEAVPDLSSLILLARALEFPIESFLAGREEETSFRFRGICAP